MKKQLSISYLISSVLLSAIVITVLNIVFLKSAVFHGLPNIIPFSLAVMLGVMLTQLGHIALYMRKNPEESRLRDVLGLNTKLPLKQYLIWVPSLILITGLLFAVSEPISALLRKYVFFWIPEWYVLSTDLSPYSVNAVWTAFGFAFIFTSILLPIIEEIFFRGFLLPRMEWLGKSTVPVNLALFACYHFWSPWMVITRFIACFPLYYVVKKKNSLMLGVIVHCSINIISDVLGGIIVYLSQR